MIVDWSCPVLHAVDMCDAGDICAIVAVKEGGGEVGVGGVGGVGSSDSVWAMCSLVL